jgi:endonuclease/exonuclease/phosphatase family metal-dependent hydrolase
MVKILSWNVCICPLGITNTKKCTDDRKISRISSIIKLCLQNDADIIVLQEVWSAFYSYFYLDYLVEEFRKNGYQYSSYNKNILSITTTGLVTISKFPLTEHNQYIFQATSGLQYLVSNGIHSCKVSLPNKTVMIYNTHLHAGDLDTRWRNSSNVVQDVQLKQVRELKQFIYETSDKSDLVVVCGDFNIDSSGNSPRLLNYDTLVEELGLGHSFNKDIITYPCPRSGSYLIPAAFKYQTTTVDHVFSNHKKIIMSVIDPVIDEEYCSDHAAIQITLIN